MVQRGKQKKSWTKTFNRKQHKNKGIRKNLPTGTNEDVQHDKGGIVLTR